MYSKYQYKYAILTLCKKKQINNNNNIPILGKHKI